MFGNALRNNHHSRASTSPSILMEGSGAADFAVRFRRVCTAFLFLITAVPGLSSAQAKPHAKGLITHRFELGEYRAPRWLRAEGLTESKLYPLGFSSDGWFAYLRQVPGEPMPAARSVELLNIHCPGLDRGKDGPSFPGDVCYCPSPVSFTDLPGLGIRGLDASEPAAFPVSWEGVQYRVETRYLGFSGTEIYLLGSDRSKRRIAVVDHQRSGALKGTVQATAWMATPEKGVFVVALGYVQRSREANAAERRIEAWPIVVNLNEHPKSSTEELHVRLPYP